MAVNILERLRSLLTEAEADTGDADPIDAIEQGLDEEGIDPIDTDEDAEPDEDTDADSDDGADADSDPDEGAPEGTQGDEEESAETAELRATILQLTAENETLRNRLAELGVEDIEDTADADADAIEDDIDVVAAFDEDYAAREARLAELLK